MPGKNLKKSEGRDIIIKDIDVIDLILLDHQYLKECIETLIIEDEDKRKKLIAAKGFVDALAKHSLAEKKSIYKPLEKNPEFHFQILEAEVEHGIVDKKVSLLKNRLARAKSLSDEVEAEFKVLSEIVKHHLKEEESELLPNMRKKIAEEDLKVMGANFMKFRKFEKGELSQMPHLEDELIQWKDSVQKLSSQFLKKMDKFVENLKH